MILDKNEGFHESDCHSGQSILILLEQETCEFKIR